MSTAVVVTNKLAVFAPAGTVTVPPKVANVLVELSCTTAPFGPAAPSSVTLIVEAPPPVTLAGARVTLDTGGMVTFKVPVTFAPLRVALTIAVVDVETGIDLTVKLADELPAVIVTVAGQLRIELPVDRDTT